MQIEGKYLSTREAADYLSLASRTLDRYRVRGTGPVFHRFGGRVRYLRSDLDAWASSRRRVSTVADGSVLDGAPEASGPVESPAKGMAARPGQAGGRRCKRTGGAVFGPETYIVEVKDDGMAPLFRAGQFVWIDPDVPAEPGRHVGVRFPETDATTVRLLLLEEGRRVLRALDPDVPDCVLDADNETMVRGVAVFWGETV